MGQWRSSTWGDEISLEYGKGIRGYADGNGPYRVFGSNGAVGWADEPLAPGPGVILGRKGAYRGVRFSPDPFYVIDTAYYVVPKTELDMRWLYYAIIHHKLGEIDDGSPIPSTTRSAVYVRELDVPEFSEQQAIAAVLSALDDKIELNRRMNGTLEASARALFRDWFVDFGPTRAKMAGATPYLAPGLWSLFPASLDTGGKPEGWGTMFAEELFDIAIGRTPPRKEQQHFVSGGDGVPWLSIRTMGGDSSYIFETDEGLTHDAVHRFRVPVVKMGTILVSFKLTVGRVAIAGVDMATNEAIAHFNRPDGCPVSNEFTYLSLKEFDFDRLGSTSSIATAVNSKSIRSIQFLVPPNSVLAAFQNVSESLFKQIRNLTQESRTLAETRDALLPKLMSGEIRVAQAEKLVGDRL